ncbi:MAG: hypothetical protein H6617_12210 [Bdellovibrionaceae bacterium]|nr:hypothetical protein [Pseudobdellovibrionaceae bacterium]
MNSIYSEINALKRKLESPAQKAMPSLELILENLSEGWRLLTPISISWFSTRRQKDRRNGHRGGGPKEWQRLYGLFETDETTPIQPSRYRWFARVSETVNRFPMFVRNPRRPEGCTLRFPPRPERRRRERPGRNGGV